MRIRNKKYNAPATIAIKQTKTIHKHYTRACYIYIEKLYLSSSIEIIVSLILYIAIKGAKTNNKLEMRIKLNVFFFRRTKINNITELLTIDDKLSSGTNLSDTVMCFANVDAFVDGNNILYQQAFIVLHNVRPIHCGNKEIFYLTNIKISSPRNNPVGRRIYIYR